MNPEKGQSLAGSLSGADASQNVTEAFQGWLSPDGNRVRRVKAQASFTARPTSRAVAKAELSDPTVREIEFCNCIFNFLEIGRRKLIG